MNKKGIGTLAIVIISVVVLGILGGSYYAYNENQKSITANAINELEQKLKGQGELTARTRKRIGGIGASHM